MLGEGIRKDDGPSSHLEVEGSRRAAIELREVLLEETILSTVSSNG